jgi:hypothetical protein
VDLLEEQPMLQEAHPFPAVLLGELQVCDASSSK